MINPPNTISKNRLLYTISSDCRFRKSITLFQQLIRRNSSHSNWGKLKINTQLKLLLSKTEQSGKLNLPWTLFSIYCSLSQITKRNTNFLVSTNIFRKNYLLWINSFKMYPNMLFTQRFDRYETTGQPVCFYIPRKLLKNGFVQRWIIVL